jgi:hypothetical protein
MVKIINSNTNFQMKLTFSNKVLKIVLVFGKFLNLQIGLIQILKAVQLCEKSFRNLLNVRIDLQLLRKQISKLKAPMLHHQLLSINFKQGKSGLYPVPRCIQEPYTIFDNGL